MRSSKFRIFLVGYCFLFWLGIAGNSYSMGLRSFVALPVEKGGAVVRVALEHEKKTDTSSLTTSMAYGINAKQTLLVGSTYQISPAGNNRQGDVSVLYRHITWQKDRLSGTDRLGLLGGIVAPTANHRDGSVQAGFVFTHFKNRHEIDINGLYQSGRGRRIDSARYDISWQYRLSPVERPNWGMPQELNSVLELNGRWNEGGNVSHQVTIGLQWIHPKLVIEGGIVNDINNINDMIYIVSTRFHF